MMLATRSSSQTKIITKERRYKWPGIKKGV